ncbi:hypothetical protein JXA05_04310 [Candidatus Peregrinibacteria bacterium]|nr:hypothetical protein [Candidatus Peregrinibacteria bacterium]
MEEKKPKKTENFFIRPIGYSLLAAVLVLAIVQITRSAAIIQRVGSDNLRLVQEFRDVKEGVIQYGQDLNEIREYLLLPVKEYALFLPEEPAREEAGRETFGAEITRFASETGTAYDLEKKQKKSYEDFVALTKNADFKSKLSGMGLAMGRMENTTETAALKLFEKKEVFSQLSLKKEKAEFEIQSILGTDPLGASQPLAEAAIAYLEANKDALRALKTRLPEQQKAMAALWEDKEIGEALSQKKCSATVNPMETESGFEYAVKNRDGQAVLAFRINRKTGDFILADQSYADAAALKPVLMEILQKLSGESETERKIERKWQELLAFLKNPDFLESLQKSHLELQPEKREEGRVYFDLTNSDDKNRVGSVIFETGTGTVIFFRASDGVEVKEGEPLAAGSKKNF